MLNWPGSHGAPMGSSEIVVESRVSRRRPRTRAGTGVSGPAACSAAAMRVDVEELEPRGLQPGQHQLSEATHQLVAEVGIRVALPTQARAVEGDRRDRLARERVQVP